MQELNGFGVTLRLVDETSAEQVRIWRNEPSISHFMEFKEEISKEMQQAWLLKVQNSGDLFYVVEAGETQQDENTKTLIGTIHLSNIDLINKTAEAGIFIGKSNFSGTGITLGASLLLLDYAFETIGLECVFAKIHEDNITAEKYNQILGFEKVKAINDSFNLWGIEKDDYRAKREKLKFLV